MRTVVYVRVSTLRQTQTIEQQLDRLRACFRSRGVELAGEDIFRDDGYSGATLNRPGLDRLRDAVRAREVEQVLVTDPDRLARSYVQLMVLLEELERAGCEVAFLDRPMSREPQDQLLLQIRGAVAGRRSCAPAACCPGPGHLTATAWIPTAPATRRASRPRRRKRPWSGSCSPATSRTTPACSAWPSTWRPWASPRRAAARAGPRPRCAAS